jgi:hypothetical protein
LASDFGKRKKVVVVGELKREEGSGCVAVDYIGQAWAMR